MTPDLPGPHDKQMWRKLMAAVHPDADEGDHELFIWVNQVLKPHARGGTPNLEIENDPHEFAARFARSTGITVPTEFWDFVTDHAKGGGPHG